MALLALSAGLSAQNSTPKSSSPSPSDSSGSSSSKDKNHSKIVLDTDIDLGTVVNGVYRNRTLGMTCKIPAGWVLRTEEMNEREEESPEAGSQEAAPKDPTSAGKSAADPSTALRPGMGHPAQNSRGSCPHMCNKVLLAAFSRPPEVHGEDVNASILIAAERVEAYPGLKEPVQYLGVLTEVAEQQGFKADVEPYEIAIGTKALVRGDFHKDVGTRVMRQSTLAMLARGYAVSITVIAGTDDEVEDLLDGIEFGSGASGK